MSSPTEDKIHCDIHGKSDYALVCQHLANQDRKAKFSLLKYYVANSNPDDTRSLAENVWCEDCDNLLQKDGDWTDESAKYANPKVVCISCLQSIMEANIKGE